MTTWKNASGRRGSEYVEIDGMSFVRRKGQERYCLVARRGTSSKVDDWGPFDLDREDAFRQGREWNDILRSKGWFEADLDEWNPELIARLVARLPRSEVIPRYFLRTLDNLRIGKGKGKGRKKDALFVGGMDVRLSDSIGRAGDRAWQPRREEANVSFAHPGSHRLDPRNVEIRVDGPALEALISFLLDVRMDLVSSETAASIDSVTFAEASQRPDDVRERIRHYYEVRDDVDRLIGTVMRMPAEKRELAYILIDQLAAGTLGFAVPETNSDEDAVRH